MTDSQRIKQLVVQGRTARERGELDAPADPGGVGLSGGETRAGGPIEGRTGAARDE
jgi:hypothetical protein